jgi:hypothetical protein
MKSIIFKHCTIIGVIIIFVCSLIIPITAEAHCDTLDGPVVVDARVALDKGDVTRILKWVTKENEEEIKEAFRKILAVRSLGGEAKELADMYFLETLIRIHRAGEGAPYTGLKPAGSVDPAVALADKALETGSVDHLLKTLSTAMEKGIRQRFSQTLEKKKHADKDAKHGREFVAAYVDYVHYVERIHLDIKGGAAHHSDSSKNQEENQHKH